MQFPRSRKWNARWVWASGDGREKNAYYYFRKTFDREGPADGCRIFIAADTRYQLFVNGGFVGRGAPQSQPFFQYYDEYDIGSLLETGENCIAVIVNHVGNLADTRAGLLAEVVGADGEKAAATGSDWRVRRADAWRSNTHAFFGNKTTPYQEFFDARQVPEGWMETGFDDSGWQACVTVGGRISDRPPAAMPWSRLVPRDIPHMTADPVLPARIERIEESLDLINRSRPGDLAPGLSMVGNRLRYSSVGDAENLCDDGAATVVRSSTEHENLDFDGLYAPAIVLDFGRIVTARIRLDVEGKAGGMVDIGYAERLIDGYFNIAMECEFADRYTMRDGRQEFECFTWKSFRYVKVRFRYCFEPVTVHSVHAVVSTYPYKPRGSFSSNDELLNDVFDISQYTVRLCSNEFIMDTPWREQAQWLGDVALVTLPAIYSCFGDTALPGKFLRQAAGNQHPTGMISNVSNIVNHNWQGTIPDYSLWWIHGVWNHYLYTGDEGWIHSLYPEALRIMQAHLAYVNERGLIEDMPYWVFIDWADVDKRGECTAYNAIFYGAAEVIGKMAAVKGDGHTEDLTSELMEGIKRSFADRLFDASKGCFADANVDGALSEKVSEQGNMAAVRWGLCDDGTAESIVDAFYDKKRVTFVEAQPFFTSVVLRALDRVGRSDLALRIIRERWGRRMVEKGETSTLEEWYHNGSWRDGPFTGFLRTSSHAWSACPADFLIRDLIGLEIVEPGCAKVRVAPKATDFDYRVTFPTPHGDVRVECVSGEIRTESGGDVEVLQ